MKKNHDTVHLATVCILFLLFSCQKHDIAGNQKEESRFTLSAAKQWFTTQGETEKLFGKFAYNPIWEKAQPMQEDDSYWVIEVPLIFDVSPAFVVGSTQNPGTGDKINATTKLVILKDKKNSTILPALMHVYTESSNFDINNFHYSKILPDFTGHVLFTKLNGNFVNGWVYQSGKIVKVSKQKNIQTIRTNSNVKLNAAPYPEDEDCSSVETKWYTRTCTYFSDGVSLCTGWSYFGSTYQDNCNSTGTGGYREVRQTNNLGDLLAAFDDQITDSLENDCLDSVFQQLKRLQSGKFAGIIKQFSGETPNWNWKVKQGSTGNANAITNMVDGSPVTIFGYNNLKKATNLSIARTMIHESVHAYLSNYFRYEQAMADKDYPYIKKEWQKRKHPDYNTIQHDQMETAFVGEIAAALKEFGKARGLNLDDSIYNDLAWGGLNFNDNSTLTDDDKIRITNRLSAEQTNSRYEDESPKGQKICLN